VVSDGAKGVMLWRPEDGRRRRLEEEGEAEANS
jgi:hypothetical protein